MALQHFWKLDDNTTNTNVLASTGTDAVLVGGDNTETLHSTDTPGGMITASFDFNGSDDYLDTPDVNYADGTAFSVSLWVKFDAFNVNLFDGGGGGAPDDRIKVNDVEAIVRTRDFNSEITFDSSISLDTWYHFLFVRKTDNLMYLYINGVLQSGTASADTLTSGYDIIRFASGLGGGSTWFDGHMAWIKIFNSDESANAASLYAEGTASATELEGVIESQTSSSNTLSRDKAILGEIASQTSDSGELNITRTITGNSNQVTRSLGSLTVQTTSVLLLDMPCQDNTASTTVVDNSESSNNGTYNGSNTNQKSHNNGAGDLLPRSLFLEGDDDYITLDSSVSLSDNYCIQFFYKRYNSSIANLNIVSGDDGDVCRLLISPNDDALIVVRGIDIYFFDITGVNLDVFNHFALTCSAQDAELFVNGVALDNQTINPSVSGPDIFITTIGHSAQSTDGYLVDIKIYNEYRNTTAIQADYEAASWNLRTNLYAYYPLQDLNDYSGNGRHLTANTPYRSASGFIGSGVSCGGDYFSSTAVEGLTGINQYTISMICRGAATAAYRFAWTLYNAPDFNTYLIGLSPYDNVSTLVGCQLYHNGAVKIDGQQGQPVADINRWDHIVFVQSGTSGAIYVSGNKVDAVNTLTDVGPISIYTVGGRADIAGQRVSGVLDEFRIYTQALNDAQIQVLYNHSGDFIEGSSNNYTSSLGISSINRPFNGQSNNITYSSAAVNRGRGLTGRSNSVSRSFNTIRRTRGFIGVSRNRTSSFNSIRRKRQAAGFINSVTYDVGLLKRNRAINSISNNSTSLTGDMKRTLSISAVVNSNSAEFGSINLNKILSAISDTISRTYGGAVKISGLNGQINSQTNLTGTINLLIPMSAASQVLTSLYGDLDIGGTEILNGQIRAMSSLAGNINLSIPLSITITGKTSTTGNAGILRTLLGTSNSRTFDALSIRKTLAISSVSKTNSKSFNTINLNKAISSVISSYTKSTGIISKLLSLNIQSQSNTSITGTANIAFGVSSIIASRTASDGSLDEEGSVILASILGSSTSLDGSINLTIPFSAQVNSTSQEYLDINLGQAIFGQVGSRTAMLGGFGNSAQLSTISESRTSDALTINLSRGLTVIDSSHTELFNTVNKASQLLGDSLSHSSIISQLSTQFLLQAAIDAVTSGQSTANITRAISSVVGSKTYSSGVMRFTIPLSVVIQSQTSASGTSSFVKGLEAEIISRTSQIGALSRVVGLEVDSLSNTEFAGSLTFESSLAGFVGVISAVDGLLSTFRESNGETIRFLVYINRDMGFQSYINTEL